MLSPACRNCASSAMLSRLHKGASHDRLHHHTTNQHAHLHHADDAGQQARYLGAVRFPQLHVQLRSQRLWRFPAEAPAGGLLIQSAQKQAGARRICDSPLPLQQLLRQLLQSPCLSLQARAIVQAPTLNFRKKNTKKDVSTQCAHIIQKPEDTKRPSMGG